MKNRNKLIEKVKSFAALSSSLTSHVIFNHKYRKDLLLITRGAH